MDAWKKTSDQVRAYMRRYEMITADDVILVGLSGGADSVCLLRLLSAFAAGGEFPPFSLVACHVHHGLRGAAADADQAFAEKLCAALGIPLDVSRVDVAALAEERGCGIEEAGRIARQAAFAQSSARRGATKVALAHHMDDQAETVLFHLLRGTGLAGLAGMRPASGGVIRPLLATRREEIRAALREKHFDWCEDASNEEDIYTRNRIRSELIPGAERLVNPEAVRHIAQTAQAAADAEDFLRAQAARCEAETVRAEKGTEADRAGTPLCVIERSLLREPEILQQYVVLSVLRKCADATLPFTAGHVAQVLDLLRGGRGRRADLPCGLAAVREGRGVVLLLHGSPDLCYN